MPNTFMCATMFESCVYHESYSLPNTCFCMQIPEEMLFEHVSKRAVIQEAVQNLLKDTFPLVCPLAKKMILTTDKLATHYHPPTAHSMPLYTATHMQSRRLL